MDDLLLYKFLQNEASEDEIRTVLDWLDADPANRKYFDGLDNMLNAARVNRPAGRKPLRRPLPSLRSIGAWSMRIAAVLCLCLGVSYFAATKMFDRKASNNSLSVFVPNGERISMTLTDGTTVWLNSGTTLEYPAVFARGERRVKVTGEAMFDVKSDPQHPFVVETFACDVRVLGTKFNVEANEEEGIFTADLLRGRVQVCNRTDRSDRITMEPNQTVHLEVAASRAGERRQTALDGRHPLHNGNDVRGGHGQVRTLLRHQRGNSARRPAPDRVPAMQAPHQRRDRPRPRGAAARGRFQVRTRYYDQYALYQITNEVRTQQPDAYEKVTENPFLPYQVLIKKENL